MIFEVQDGVFSYKGSERKILDGISFCIDEGDILAILGPNGAGKTTLLKCAVGILDWQSGQSLLYGKNLKKTQYSEIWRKIGYVPQAKPLSVCYTVWEMICLGRSSHIGLFASPSKKDIEKVDEVISFLHLEKLRNRKCSEISGGELQLVLIARALAGEPKVLILDEPESNLDFRNQLYVLDTMSYLSSKGLCCIFNTHYPAHALRRANKSLMLCEDGRTIYGKTQEIVTEKSIGDFFGVKAVIGDIETQQNIYRDVIPVGIKSDSFVNEKSGSFVACVSIIMQNNSMAERINGAIHEFSEFLIGRMGMPYSDGGLYIINLVLDAPQSEIYSLIQKLNVIPDVSVKATFAKEVVKNDKP